jgi:fluoride exporter
VAWQALGVGVGAALGAWLRWGLAASLNPGDGRFPFGTWVANVLGGLLVGIAVAFFAERELDPWWRLFVITGFLGGLTTFSTFSAEVFARIASHDFAGAFLLATAHLVGSLVATAAGFAWYQHGIPK